MPGFEKGQELVNMIHFDPFFSGGLKPPTISKSFNLVFGRSHVQHTWNQFKKKKHIPNRSKQTICHTQRKPKRDVKRLSYPSWLVILGMWVKHPRLQQLRQVENLPPPPQELIFQETKWLGKAWLFFFHKGVASILVGCHIHQGFSDGTVTNCIGLYKLYKPCRKTYLLGTLIAMYCDHGDLRFQSDLDISKGYQIKWWS